MRTRRVRRDGHRRAGPSGRRPGGRAISRKLEPVDADQLVVEPIEQHHEEQQHGRRAPRRAPAGLPEPCMWCAMRLEINLPVVAAHQGRGDVVADGHDEDEQHPGGEARDGQRHVDLGEGVDLRCTHRTGGAHVGRRDGLHHAVERQDHEGQQDVGHRHDGADLIVDHAHSPTVVEQAEPDQHVVDDALLLQQDDPGGGAHQQRGPEGQQHQDHQQVGGLQRQSGQQEGHGIAQQNAEPGDQHRHPGGAPEERAIDLIALRPLHHLAFGGVLVVEGQQVVDRRDRAGLALHQAPELQGFPNPRRAPGRPRARAATSRRCRARFPSSCCGCRESRD